MVYIEMLLVAAAWTAVGAAVMFAVDVWATRAGWSPESFWGWVPAVTLPPLIFVLLLTVADSSRHLTHEAAQTSDLLWAPVLFGTSAVGIMLGLVGVWRLARVSWSMVVSPLLATVANLVIWVPLLSMSQNDSDNPTIPVLLAIAALTAALFAVFFFGAKRRFGSRFTNPSSRPGVPGAGRPSVA